MDYKEPVKHNKKKDKAREKHERFGGFSSRHVRAVEARLESAAAKGKGAAKEKPKKKLFFRLNHGKN